MTKTEVLTSLKEIGLVPVLRAESVDKALALAEAGLRSRSHRRTRSTRSRRTCTIFTRYRAPAKAKRKLMPRDCESIPATDQRDQPQS